MQQIIDFILFTVSDWGYWGIFSLMFIESSFIPFPSEIIIVPAGYLAFKGEMNLLLILLTGTFGSIAGALFNYYLALFVGRKFLHKYGKYFFLEEASLDKAEEFFRKHGVFSTFTGRLIPMIRQLISIPAGLARMNVGKFCFYTGLGAGIWVMILALIGYFIGQNEELIHEYLRVIVLTLLVLVAVGGVFYVRWQKKKA